jgi:hypothetical protein
VSGNGEAPAPAPIRLVIEFPADGRCDVSIVPENVTPAHVYLGAWMLERYANEVRAATLAAGPRLVTAGPATLDHLGKGGGRRT